MALSKLLLLLFLFPSTAIQEQLGLKLEPAKEPVPVLRIDHIDLPTQNWYSCSKSDQASLAIFASQ